MDDNQMEGQSGRLEWGWCWPPPPRPKTGEQPGGGGGGAAGMRRREATATVPFPAVPHSTHSVAGRKMGQNYFPSPTLRNMGKLHDLFAADHTQLQSSPPLPQDGLVPIGTRRPTQPRGRSHNPRT